MKNIRKWNEHFVLHFVSRLLLPTLVVALMLCITGCVKPIEKADVVFRYVKMNEQPIKFPTSTTEINVKGTYGEIQQLRAGAIPDVEREALIALYNSTNGDNWTNKYNWLGPPGTECNWYGITCNRNSVTGLKLGNNNLVGQIPSELGNLKSLGGLVLNGNQLSGSIPPELGNLKSCIMLELSNNQLSGSIPPELGNHWYAWLNLSNNQLSCPIPAKLQTAIFRLDLHNNQLSGSIPPRLGGLYLIDLRYNQLSGSIPPELGNPKLGGLGLSNNQLSGPIPPELGNLKKLKKENCDFRYNALYTDDTSIRKFLNSKQNGGDWEATQTVAPTDVTADVLTRDSIKVSWTPIRFKELSGGYHVFYGTSSGGPYTLFGTTDNKNVSFLTVTGLNPETTYYFVVQTVTFPHDMNQNTMMSEYSKETIGVQIP